MDTLFVRSGFPFNYDTNAASDESGLDCSVDGVGRAKQSFAEECDINTIVKRFHLTGELPSNVRAPVSQDFIGVFDFQSAMNAVRSAEESFMEMPAEVRTRFNNDPEAFVKFCSDDANKEEAKKLGLVFEPVVAAVTPQLVRVVQDEPKIEPKAVAQSST